MSKNQILEVPIKSVKVDVDQPRKNFDPERLGELIASIKKHGIISPLQVQDMGNGTYLLEDGERRYRAATEIGLKEIPVVIQKKTGDVERLVRQFHIQEQHEGWSPTEKATAVAKLAEAMKVGVKEMATLLSLPERSIRDYTAFANLIERKEFERSESALHFANGIVSARKFIVGQFEKKGLEFTKEMQSGLELAFISRLKNGDIKKSTDINKVRDSARTSPTLILKFIKNKNMSTQKLFIDADAKVAHHYRNAIYAARMVKLHVDEGMKLKMGRFLEGNTTDVRVLNKTKESIDELLAKA